MKKLLLIACCLVGANAWAAENKFNNETFPTSEPEIAEKFKTTIGIASNCYPFISHYDEVAAINKNLFYGKISQNIANAQIENMQEGFYEAVSYSPIPPELYAIFSLDNNIHRIVFGSKGSDKEIMKFKNFATKICIDGVTKFIQQYNNANQLHDYTKD